MMQAARPFRGQEGHFVTSYPPFRSAPGQVYRRRVALSGSTSRSNGAWVALVGPNGAGKTALLRSVIGLVTPDEGSIDFEGASIDPTIRRAALGYAPQGNPPRPSPSASIDAFGTARPRQPDPPGAGGRGARVLAAARTCGPGARALGGTARRRSSARRVRGSLEHLRETSGLPAYVLQYPGDSAEDGEPVIRSMNVTSPAELPGTIERLAGEGVNPDTIRINPTSFETVFQALVSKGGPS